MRNQFREVFAILREKVDMQMLCEAVGHGLIVSRHGKCGSGKDKMSGVGCFGPPHLTVKKQQGNNENMTPHGNRASEQKHVVASEALEGRCFLFFSANICKRC